MRPPADLLLSLLDPGHPGVIEALEQAALEINGEVPGTPPVKQHGTPPQWEFSNRTWYIRACRKKGIPIDQERLQTLSV